MLVLITYDVNTETAAGRSRLRKVAKQCTNYGQRVQNSVFECNMDAAKCRQVKAILEEIIDKDKDSLRFYYLGAVSYTHLDVYKRQEVQLFAKNNNGLYGNRNFYLGMLERLLFSSLMDADWRDTADFMENRKTDTGMSQDEIQKVWEYGIITLENKLNELDKTSEIASCRQDISARCRNAAYASGNLFRLSVPTGAGKTLSTLRFALHCAKANKKRHIFYCLLYTSRCV